MIIVPMRWDQVPADATIILSDGRYAGMSWVPVRPSAGHVPVLAFSAAEHAEGLARAVTIIARYFTIDSITSGST